MENSTIHQRISQLMERYGLNANSLSVKLGTSDTVVRKILNGKNKPGFDTLTKIIQTFEGINVVWLVTGKGTMTIDPDLDAQFIIPKGGGLFVNEDGVEYIHADRYIGEEAVLSSNTELHAGRVRQMERQIADYLETMKLLRSQIEEYKQKCEDCGKDKGKSKRRSA